MSIIIKRSRRKTLQLSVHLVRNGTSNGVNPAIQIIVRAPLTLPLSRIQLFVQQKQAWINRAIHRQSNRLPLPHSPQDYKKNKSLARKIILERLNQLNDTYQLHWKRLTIRNSRTRWGSCSRQGNLNFNYRIIYLPPELQDYVIVHELCHLQELNHGKKFWQLVTRVIPNFSVTRKQLRQYSL
ncbi:MAG: M48 family metallopeptidase [Candidatus Komeilibacteria bacterium]